MGTNSKQFHEEFMQWASNHGALFFHRSTNVNGRDTYEDPSVQLAWRLWQDVADGVVKPEPDRHG
jgi:hypothetical protein